MHEVTEPYGIETIAIRAGQRRSAEAEHNEPIFTTSSFVFENAADAAAKFSGKISGNVYSRFTNPTVRGFEERLAAMEGGRFAIATASGMSAILCLALSVLKAGDRVAVSENVFGSTVSLFTKTLSSFGVSTDFVPITDLSAWERAMTRRTRLLFVETPSNPTCEIADLESLSKIAKDAGALLAVDNVYCTPILQTPIAFGADVVVHSATKYLDGQGRCVGGALVVNDRALYDDLFNTLRTTGPSMSPFNAWVFQKGLETLALRMKAHCDHAAELAHWLKQHPSVRRVYYPGLTTHPGHCLALKQQGGFGGIVSFEIHGSRSDAWQVIDNTRLLSITANLGDTKSTITHPASTTHARISEQQRRAAGITDSMLRIGVGLENPDDIKTDIERGLDAITPSASRVAN